MITRSRGSTPELRVAPLMILPDEDALGPKVFPQTRFPRPAAFLSLPIASSFIGQISLPGEMSPEEWDRLVTFLDKVRPALVHEEPA